MSQPFYFLSVFHSIFLLVCEKQQTMQKYKTGQVYVQDLPQCAFANFKTSIGSAENNKIIRWDTLRKEGVPRFLYSALSDCGCYNPMLAISVDQVTHALYFLFITPLYQVGTDFVILSYQFNTSFA